MALTRDQLHLLRDIAGDYFLKSHRLPDGQKYFLLHALDGTTRAVAWPLAQSLIEAGLIDSNKKFPAATYWLTPAGREALSKMGR